MTFFGSCGLLVLLQCLRKRLFVLLLAYLAGQTAPFLHPRRQACCMYVADGASTSTGLDQLLLCAAC
jgi:hypothetical protein